MPKKFRTSKDKSGSAYVHPIGTAPKGAKVSPKPSAPSKPSRPVAPKGGKAPPNKSPNKSDPIAEFREFARLKGIGPSHTQATVGDVAKIPRPKKAGGGSWQGGYFVRSAPDSGVKRGTFTGKWDKKNPPRDMVKKGDLAVFANTGKTGKKKYVILSKQKALSMVKDSQSKKIYNRFHKRVSVKEHSTYVPWEIHTQDPSLLKLFGI
jgi:hypothetical protein